MTRRIRLPLPLPLLAWWAAQWAYRRVTAWGRTLPDFVVVGAQRCGTTSLYNYLADHPHVAPSFMKETHFFDLHFGRGPGWYRAHFPSARRARQHALLVGEATPYYLFYPHAPRRLRATLPNARLIVVLRNPVDRAYSHYHHEVDTGFETTSFEQALEREESILPAETAKILDNESYSSFAHFHYSYLSRGIYVDQLARWGQFFTREQMLILKSEEFYEQPAAVMARVTDFLRLPALTSTTYKKYNEARYAPMEVATRRRLAACFQPHNERLYAYLGADFGWE